MANPHSDDVENWEYDSTADNPHINADEFVWFGFRQAAQQEGEVPFFDGALDLYGGGRFGDGWRIAFGFGELLDPPVESPQPRGASASLSPAAEPSS